MGRFGSCKPVEQRQLEWLVSYFSWSSWVGPQSLCNRICCWRFWVLTLIFCCSVGVGICHSIESDLFIFLSLNGDFVFLNQNFWYFRKHDTVLKTKMIRFIMHFLLQDKKNTNVADYTVFAIRYTYHSCYSVFHFRKLQQQRQNFYSLWNHFHFGTTKTQMSQFIHPISGQPRQTFFNLWSVSISGHASGRDRIKVKFDNGALELENKDVELDLLKRMLQYDCRCKVIQF